MSNELFAFGLGVLIGAAVVLIIQLINRRTAREVAEELVNQTEAEKIQNLEILLDRIKDSFGALSQKALSDSSSHLLQLANETLSVQTRLSEKELEGKKALIDQHLGDMRERLAEMQEQVARFEREREQKYGEINAGIRSSVEQTAKLRETTDRLQRALASTKARGQWGERMAEDVLRLAGFIEGVNYLKQKALEAAGSRPDYTFPLPQGRKLNMDVKFPLDNYMRFHEADKEAERESYKAQFLRDVKARVKEVTTRDYINPDENTLDYVLVFIPNEQVYAFINENDPAIVEEALKSRVILCSPFTLYAILAIIRQAMDVFNLEKTAGDMLKLLGSFAKQWEMYVKSMDKMGKKIEEARDEFQTLTTTRRNQLERQIERIEDLRKQRGIEVETEPPLAEGEVVSSKALEEGNEEV